MIKAPIITVLMPVYNCSVYINEAVESILNQTFSDFEFLIIDDASTDDTVSKIKAYKDSRINLIQKEKNTGYTNSLNYGLSIAKGKYIARMDGDDISLLERFEKQVAFMEANEDVVVCGTTYSIIGSNTIVNVPEFHNYIKVGLLKQSELAHPTVMLRKSIFVDNHFLYDNSMEPAEDYDLWVRISSIGKLYNLQECLLEYRKHKTQVSNIRSQKQIENTKHIRLKMLKLLENNISEEYKKIYLAAIDKKVQIDFNDYLKLINLKNHMIFANRDSFFESNNFKKYWLELEMKFHSYYFKNRSEYSLIILKEYLYIRNKTEIKLNRKELFKLIVKSCLNYKVKYK